MDKIENDKQSSTKIWMIIGVISLGIAILLGLLILNWFFQITTFQRLEGAPILLTLFINPIGIFLGVLSFSKTQYIIAKWSIIVNSVMLTLPFLYFFLGTLIFGP